MPSRRSPLARRRLAVLGLGALVTLAHFGLGHWWWQQRVGFGAGDAPVQAIEVHFVKPLALATPPARPAAPAPRRSAAPAAPTPAPEAATPVQPPASEATGTALLPAEVASADNNPLDLPQGTSTEATPTFEWPPSTQLRYELVGNYRGPVKGWAEVTWLREGDHYQVKLELRVPPLFGRRILSDGVVGPEGLTPRRYDQDTEVLLRDTVHDTLLLEPDTVLLANGQRTRNLPGVQDTASQFVQLTWLFTTQPELLQVGNAVEFPLALPRRVVPWRYEITEQVPLQLPFGEAMTFHLQPAPGLSRPGELAVEIWIAPALQYLPVRILVRQNTDSFLELNLKSAPLQEAPAPQ